MPSVASCMGRFAETEEMALVVAFVASKDRSFMTAPTFLVDGRISASYTTPRERVNAVTAGAPISTFVADIVAGWSRRPRRAVIFDFNGTLSNDEMILERIFTELFSEHLGWSMTPHDYRDGLLGRSDREIVQIAVDTHADGDPGLVEQLLQRRGAQYSVAVAETSPISRGTTELVQRLSAARVPMAVVTGAEREEVLAVLRNSPVGYLIAALVTEEDLTRGKPDPEGFLLGAQLLGVDPGDVLVFEDSLPGIHGAARAGMACVAVGDFESGSAIAEETVASISTLDSAVLNGTDI